MPESLVYFVGILLQYLLGYTYKNTMMKMQSWYNEKLKLRAKRMIVQEFHVPESEAQKVLEKYSYKIDEAFRHFSEKAQK